MQCPHICRVKRVWCFQNKYSIHVPELRNMHTKHFFLSLLFYGSECWILSAMRDKIQKFHRSCIKFMCGVTLASMQSKNIHHTDLEKPLQISDVLLILESRSLQGLGHAYTPMMPADRIPRRLLSSWLMCPRPKGRPHLTYGHGLVKDPKTHSLQ